MCIYIYIYITYTHCDSGLPKYNRLNTLTNQIFFIPLDMQ